MTRALKALITKSSLKERLRTAFSYLNKLRELCEDVRTILLFIQLLQNSQYILYNYILLFLQAQQGMPDIFIWLISNGKRLAYQRIPARDIIYSDVNNECGKFCGQIQTINLKVRMTKNLLQDNFLSNIKCTIQLCTLNIGVLMK